MKRLSILLSCVLLTLLSAQEASAQNWSATKYSGVEQMSDGNIHAVRIDLSKIGVTIYPQVSFQQNDIYSPEKWARVHNYEIAVTANFFGPVPSGSAITNGCSRGGASSDIYAEIGFTKDYVLKWFRQSETDDKLIRETLFNGIAGSPELIADGSIISDEGYKKACKLLGDCTKPTARTGICVDKGSKHLILAVTKGDGANGGRTMADFAHDLQKAGCDYAINLKGGKASGLYIADSVNGKTGKTYGTNTDNHDSMVNLGFNIAGAQQYKCESTCVSNASNLFCDISQTHWGLEAVEKLVENGITKGCGQSSGKDIFCTECGIKRGDAAAFLFRSLKIPEIKPETASFIDVPKDIYYYAAVETLLAKGIIPKSKAFHPEDVIMRGEAAEMVARAFVDGAESYKDAQKATFDDVGIDNPAFPYVEALVRNCIASGISPTQYVPEKEMTRVEFAMLMSKGAKLLTTDPSKCPFKKQCELTDTPKCENDKATRCIANEWISDTCTKNEICKDGFCIKNSTEPDKPTQPDTPAEPDKPTHPDTPAEPDKSENPDTPTEPDTPAQPDKPEKPDTPTEPDTPTQPDKPVKPDTPTQPDDDDSNIYYETSCSANLISGHHMPWFFALLLGGLAMMRRPRKQTH